MLAVIGGLHVVSASAQSFVEYPGHPATYGDHFVTATWVGGPTTVTVELQTDESVLHGDGIGQSQRTARNTLNYVAPSDPGNPQNYDDLDLVAVYGSRLPLLQHIAADGVSTLSYTFSDAVIDGVDLLVADLDTSDDVTVRAFGVNGLPLDMTTWNLTAEGDLSLYKDTGTVFSPIIAPTPTTTFATNGIQLIAVDGTNYNRSYSVLRAPPGTGLERIEIEFTGIQNSQSRAQGGTGSHVYVALATPAQVTAAPPGDPHVSNVRLRAQSPARGVVPIWFSTARSRQVKLEVFDVAGRRVAAVWRGRPNSGEHRIQWNATQVPAGVYYLALEGAGVRTVRTLVLLR